MTACSRTTTSQLSKFALFLPPLLFYIDPRSSPRQTDNPSFLDSVWTRAVRVLFLFTAFADIKAFVTYSCEDDSIRGQQEEKKIPPWLMMWSKHKACSGEKKKKKKSLSGMMIYLLSCHSKWKWNKIKMHVNNCHLDVTLTTRWTNLKRLAVVVLAVV